MYFWCLALCEELVHPELLLHGATALLIRLYTKINLSSQKKYYIQAQSNCTCCIEISMFLFWGGYIGLEKTRLCQPCLGRPFAIRIWSFSSIGFPSLSDTSIIGGNQPLGRASGRSVPVGCSGFLLRGPRNLCSKKNGGPPDFFGLSKKASFYHKEEIRRISFS